MSGLSPRLLHSSTNCTCTACPLTCDVFLGNMSVCRFMNNPG